MNTVRLFRYKNILKSIADLNNLIINYRYANSDKYKYLFISYSCVISHNINMHLLFVFLYYDNNTPIVSDKLKLIHRQSFL